MAYSHRLLFILVLSLSLSACGVSGIVTGMQVFYQRHSLLKDIKNHYIGIKANHLLFKDKRIFADSQISVESFNNDLILVGQTPHASSKKLAQQMLSTINGVRNIYNEIQIGAPISSKQQFEDTWITSKIKTQIIANHNIDPSQFKVVTENGVVYLLGDAERGQAQTVAHIARDTAGVRKVVRLYRYIEYSRA